MVLQSHRLATAHAALASTGILNLKPGSTNTVPESVRFSLDISAPADTVEALEAQIVADFEKIAAGEGVGSLNESVTQGRPCSVKITVDGVSSAVRFHPDCIKAVTEAAVSALGIDSGELTQEMGSGAGHDTVYTSRCVPTSMIFAPCRDGV
jgi:acetylornithine deacetylase/succinyl-diaminopimelate desuccinylase-like protein